MRQQLLRPHRRRAVHRLQQPVVAEQLVVRVRRLRHAVRVLEDRVAGSKPDRLIAELIRLRHTFEVLRLPHRERHPAGLRQELPRPVLIEQQLFVSGVGVGQLAGRDLQDTEPDRHEHVLFVVFGQRGVRFLQQLLRGQRGIRLRLRLEDRARRHHEKRRRHALTAHVRHDQREAVAVDEEEIVEVAADLSGRVHRRVDVELLILRKRRKQVRQHVRLDPGRHVQLRRGRRQRL